jgi:hypothetical protein
MKQRVEEIGAKQGGNEQPYEGFDHSRLLSKTRKPARIGGDDNEEKDAESGICEIGHEPFLLITQAGTWPLPHQGSIRNNHSRIMII